MNFIFQKSQKLLIMNALRQSKQLLVFFLIGLITFGLPACKGGKSAEKAAAAEKARKIGQAKSELQALLANKDMSVEDKERRLNYVKGLGVSDEPEVASLISKLESEIKVEKERLAAEAKKKAEEEARRKAEEERLATEKAAPTIYDYFDNIVVASDATEANRLISKALSLFTSPDAPVLIIINQEDGITDYDKPTTIKKYFEYLKDQKKDLNKIEKVIYDKASGKIKELELIRK